MLIQSDCYFQSYILHPILNTDFSLSKGYKTKTSLYIITYFIRYIKLIYSTDYDIILIS